MPFIKNNHLHKRLARGCILIALPVALGWVGAFAAYLPASGPVPLRFRPAPAPRLKPNPSPPPPQPDKDRPDPTTAETGPPYHPTLDFDTKPSPWEQENQVQTEIITAKPQEKPVVTEVDPITAMREDPSVFPQFLVPFFTGQFAATNVPPVNIKVVEFMPPVKQSPPSSSATYQSH